METNKEGNMKWDVQNLASTPHFIRLFSTYPQDAISAAYKALGLKNNANLTEVKAAYRRLALKWYIFSFTQKFPKNYKRSQCT